MHPELKRFDNALRDLAFGKPVPNPGHQFPDFYSLMADILEAAKKRIDKLENELQTHIDANSQSS